MDINKIFGIFNDDDDEFFPNQNFKIIDDLNIKDTPIYKIGMFEKMILNIKSAVKFQVIDIFKKSEVDFDLKEIEETGEYIAYYRAWDYIKDCNLEDINWKESLLLRETEYLLTSLKFAISYFEDYEDYEKCGFLYNIETFLEDSLASNS
jgi:hypothetical protein